MRARFPVLTACSRYLIMEYVPGGELFDYLVRRGRLPPSEALKYFQQIIYAVDYCHRFNICHRDLKPENLLLDKDKNIKVADFGMAAWQADERMLETSCGSPHYASPEIVAGKMYNGSASDIWSCGIILFALLTGRLPFDDDNIRALLQKVKIGLFDMPDDIDHAAQDLLRRMLEKDPEERITMAEIVRHPFFCSHAPRLVGGRELPMPPSLDIMARPVAASEIEPEIMKNLKTLWHGASDNEIYGALMSPEKTWEKAIYHLLIKYRDRHLENYNMEGDSEEESEEDRARPHMRPVGHVSHRRAATIAGRTPTKRETILPPMPAVTTATTATAAVAQTIRRKPIPLSENDTIQHHHTPPPRPQAPTPKKAAGEPEVESGLRTPSKLGPRTAGPSGPRSPVTRQSATASTGAPTLGPIAPTPAITLQEATPIKDLQTNGIPQKAAVQNPLSPNAVAPRSPPATDSTVIPLSPPVVDNRDLQTFLVEIANQLNSMNIRSSTASSNSNGSLPPEYATYLNYTNGTPLTSPGVAKAELRHSSDDDQFADASDDETEAMSLYSVSVHEQRNYAPSPVPSPISPLPNVGHPFGTHRAPSRSGPPPVSGRWSQASGSYRARSVSSRCESPVTPVMSPGIFSPNPGFSAFDAPPRDPNNRGSTYSNPPNTLLAERPAPPPPGKLHPPGQHHSHQRQRSYQFQGSQLSPVQQGTRSGPREREHVESGLGARDNSYVFVDAENAPEDPSTETWGKNSALAHRAADGFGMLKKRRKTTSGAIENIAPISSHTPTEPQVKRSWFNNLFSFKPASRSVQVKSHSVHDARDKVRKVLENHGVRANVTDIDGQRGLKCRTASTRDIHGNSIKGVRFRVEFTRALTSQGYVTDALLTLEKGAQSTFNNTCDRLQRSLDAEANASPPVATVQHQYTFTHPHPRSTVRGARPSLFEGGLFSQGHAYSRSHDGATSPAQPMFASPVSPVMTQPLWAQPVAVPSTIRN